VANIEHDHTRTFTAKADEVEVAQLNILFQDLEQLGQDKMQQDRVPAEAVRVSRHADLRYVGQSYELEVALPLELEAVSILRAVADFHTMHHQVYGHSRPTHAVEFVNIRTVHSAPLPRPQLLPSAVPGRLEEARKGSRQAYFDEYHAYHDTPIYSRAHLPVDVEIEGPAIVEQPDTTTVVYPGQRCRVDAAGNLLIREQAPA
jgi:N-methylhydantoinase A